MEIRSLEQYHQAYNKSVEDPEAFWGSIAKDFVWKKPPESILTWDFKKPQVRWFEDGQLNITENCLDRHLEDKGNHHSVDRCQQVRLASFQHAHRLHQIAQLTAMHQENFRVIWTVCVLFDPE